VLYVGIHAHTQRSGTFPPFVLQYRILHQSDKTRKQRLAACRTSCCCCCCGLWAPLWGTQPRGWYDTHESVATCCSLRHFRMDLDEAQKQGHTPCFPSQMNEWLGVLTFSFDVYSSRNGGEGGPLLTKLLYDSFPVPPQSCAPSSRLPSSLR